MAPTLYYTEASAPVRSVLVTGKALGITFDLKKINLLAGEHMKPEFLKINPQHTIPTLVEEDGFILWDSHAITTYLVEKYGKDDSLYPQDLQKRAIVDQRLHFDASVLGVRIATPVRPIVFGSAKELTKEHVDNLKEAYAFLETFLDGHEYIAGNHLTIADIHIGTSLTTSAVLVPVIPSEFPKLEAWLLKIEAVPYFKEMNSNGVKQFEQIIKSKLS